MKDFTLRILKWYAENKRDLPWRKTNDPYKIWLSEIILQQTRVDQGRDYYLRFVEAFPGIHAMAESSEEKVLKLWQGLGYYSRARNLHATARQVSGQYHGRFPETYDELLGLKGIGPYTAAAIASIAFGRAVPVIDGNVIRVLARYYGIKEAYGNARQKKIFESYAWQSLYKQDAGTYNQAIMEFGALYCTPSKPDCTNCILKENCFAHNENLVPQLPVRTARIGLKQRYFNYLVIRYKNKGRQEIYFRRRNAEDIWKNLYDFPLIESGSFLKNEKLLEKVKDLAGHEISFLKKTREFQHLLTHRKIRASFFIFDLSKKLDLYEDCIWVNHSKLRELPVPRLIEKFLQEEKYL